MNAFSGLGHDDFARGFGAPHAFDWQIIDTYTVQPANVYCRAFFYQRGCASNHVGVVGSRFGRVYNDGVRAWEVLQMEPHGVLRCLFNERVILGLICAHLDLIVYVENLGVHYSIHANHTMHPNLNQFYLH